MENDISIIYLIYIFARIYILSQDKLSDLHFRSYSRYIYILSTRNIDRNSIENRITYFFFFRSRNPCIFRRRREEKKRSYKFCNASFVAKKRESQDDKKGKKDEETRIETTIGTTGGSKEGGENGFQAITTPEYFNDEMLVEG